MSYESVSTDTGFYEDETANITIKNYEFLWILKSAMKSGALEIKGSADGDSIYSNSADVLTNNTARSPVDWSCSQRERR